MFFLVARSSWSLLAEEGLGRGREEAWWDQGSLVLPFTPYEQYSVSPLFNASASYSNTSRNEAEKEEWMWKELACLGLD